MFPKREKIIIRKKNRIGIPVKTIRLGFSERMILWMKAVVLRSEQEAYWEGSTSKQWAKCKSAIWKIFFNSPFFLLWEAKRNQAKPKEWNQNPFSSESECHTHSQSSLHLMKMLVYRQVTCTLWTKTCETTTWNADQQVEEKPFWLTHRFIN